MRFTSAVKFMALYKVVITIKRVGLFIFIRGAYIQFIQATVLTSLL